MRWNTFGSIPKETVAKGIWYALEWEKDKAAHGLGYYDNEAAARAARSSYHPNAIPHVFYLLPEATPVICNAKLDDIQQGETTVNNHRYNVIYQPLPTLEDVQRGIKPNPVEIVPATDVMAASEAHVRMIAAKRIPDEYDDKLEMITINVKSGL